ncbi:MAG: hypothetical protein H6739_22280 [Alphaproteobacteria bacterium]|nr:hypothetical protein [Alphaproteobacteria bacterium]
MTEEHLRRRYLRPLWLSHVQVRTLVGVAFGSGVDLDGDGHEALPAVDPWGVGEGGH